MIHVNVMFFVCVKTYSLVYTKLYLDYPGKYFTI